MNNIFTCPKCGNNHRVSNWEDCTYNLFQINAANYSIYSCPTCKEISNYEEIDLISDHFRLMFWPYYLDEELVLNQYPKRSNW